MFKRIENEKKKFMSKYDEELKKIGVFFAIDKKEFEEKKPYKDVPDEEYINYKNYKYVHISDKSKMDKFYQEDIKALKKEFTDKIKVEYFIEYELYKNDCYITNNYNIVIYLVDFFYELPYQEILNKVKVIYDFTKDKYLKKMNKKHKEEISI